MPDWTGNHRSIYSTIGASNHTDKEREADDFYATDPVAIDLLVAAFGGAHINSNIWEPACGQGHLSERLKHHGFKVYSTDLVDRGYGDDHFDFLTSDLRWHGDIITNPPYKYALPFVQHGLELVDNGSRVFMFLKLSFLESKVRYPFFRTLQLEKVLVFADRIQCAKNGDFDALHTRSAVAFAWFVFKKGYGMYPEIRWIG